MRDEYIYEKKKIGKYTVKVLHDPDPMNPRKEWDNLATMICFHRRYNLGDDHSFTDPQDEDLISLLKRKDVYWLPLYLYDHSGITMSTGSFSCPWDSGQVGYIYLEKERFLKETGYGFTKMTKKAKEKLYELLRGEVETYDNYLTGSVYGFRVEDESDSVIESCWGFYGDTKDCLKEGIYTAQACIRSDIQKHVKIRKVQIKNRVPLEYRTGLTV